MSHAFRCPACGAELGEIAVPLSTARLACTQILGGVDEFHATGFEAMEAQERIIGSTNKMLTLRAYAPYVTSAVFAIISALLIIFAPDSRSTAANIVAAALLITSLGIAGYAQFSAKLPGMRIEGGRLGNSN
jgi:hypothetical protein